MEYWERPKETESISILQPITPILHDSITP